MFSVGNKVCLTFSFINAIESLLLDFNNGQYHWVIESV